MVILAAASVIFNILHDPEVPCYFFVSFNGLQDFEVSVKEPCMKASAGLASQGRSGQRVNQTVAGLMKPNLVSDLIQRGALR